MKKLAFFIVLFFSCGFIFSQDLDSLKQVVSETSGNKKAEALFSLSLYYISKNDSLSLLYINNSIKEISNNDILKGKTIFHKGMVNRSIKNDELAIIDLEKSVSILKNIDSISAADALYWLQRIHQRKGLFPKALKYGYQELDYRKALKDENQTIKSLLELGYTYDRMGDYTEAIKWHRKGVKKAKAVRDKYYIAWGTGLIGIAYDELKMYDSALYYNKNAVKLFKEIDDEYFLKTWYSNISNTYTKLSNLKLAEEYILKSLAIDIPSSIKSISLINLGKIYIDTNRYKKAQIMLDSAMVIINKNDQKRFASEAYVRYHELRKKQNNYKEALAYFVKHKEVEDQLLNETKAEQITKTKIEYDTAEKEKQILIQRAELAEQSLTIQKQNYQLYGLIALALILGLIGYLFYNQQKLKNRQLQKENELKDALVKIETQNRLQEQRLRISRDLHDNIGAQLTFIISSIDNLKYGFDIKDPKLTNKLESISHFATDTIYELRDTIWAMNKNKITIEDLKSRITNYINKAKDASKDISFKFEMEESVNQEKIFTSIDGMHIYRIIQEAIHNSLKYAQASKIDVFIKKSTNNLVFQIIDNGIGFDFDSVEKGNGLLNMEKRASQLNGNLQILSQANKGTQIIVTI